MYNLCNIFFKNITNLYVNCLNYITNQDILSNKIEELKRDKIIDKYA